MEHKAFEKITKSVTLKGVLIAIMSLILLIPGAMLQELILERQYTRNKAVEKIDAKWSYAQTISGPVLVIPYSQIEERDGKSVVVENTFCVTPETLNIDAELFPEERYYGIYKTILYRSTLLLEGSFAAMNTVQLPEGDIHWDRACFNMGLSDLRGISDEIEFLVNGTPIMINSSGKSSPLMSEILKTNTMPVDFDTTLGFSCRIDLNGSESINFLPMGRNTKVHVAGLWPDPGFVGNYTPEYTLDNGGFKADWNILHYNRTIPDTWVNDIDRSGGGISFGVSLVDTVDIYQQNMRSVKYAFMFIVLTFVVFFFVEIISRKRIHPVQYLLVGVALILFYALLLSISESIGFAWAYLISSAATIALITIYASGIFKNGKQTFALALILTILYLFLYIILQLEQAALLAGSIGLFVILGVIMFFSRRIDWYSEKENGKSS